MAKRRPQSKTELPSDTEDSTHGPGGMPYWGGTDAVKHAMGAECDSVEFTHLDTANFAWDSEHLAVSARAYSIFLAPHTPICWPGGTRRALGAPRRTMSCPPSLLSCCGLQRWASVALLLPQLAAQARAFKTLTHAHADTANPDESMRRAGDRGPECRQA